MVSSTIAFGLGNLMHIKRYSGGANSQTQITIDEPDMLQRDKPERHSGNPSICGPVTANFEDDYPGYSDLSLALQRAVFERAWSGN